MGLEEQVAELSARVAELELRLGTSRRPGAVAPPPPPAGAIAGPPPPYGAAAGRADVQPAPLGPAVGGLQPPAPAASRTAARTVTQPDWFTTETLLKWAGLTLVVLAAIFFVGTAISRGWIGPEVQLAGATAIGLALLAGGFRLVDKNRPWAVALAVGGAIVVPVCAAASNGALDLLSEYPALVALGVVTVGLGMVSHRLSMQSVAAVAALGAAVLPFWIIEDVDVPALVPAGWLAALIVIGTVFGWYRSWSIARLVTVAAGGLALLVLAADPGDLSGAEETVALVAIAIVSATAWAGPAVPALRGATDAAWVRSLDHRSVLSLPLWAWGMVGGVLSFDSSDRFAVLGIAISGLHLLAAVVVWYRLPKTLVAAHVLGAGVLLSVSLAVLTDSPALLVALAVQAAASAVLAKMFKDWFLAAYAALLGAIAVAWTVRSTVAGLFEQESIGQLLANLAVLVLLGGGAAYGWTRRQDQVAVPFTVATWLGVLGWLASVLIHRPQGQVIVSLIWAVIAAAGLVIGVRIDNQLTRILAFATLALVLGKLLTVDLAEVDTLWRVGLFLVVGSGLLRLGYVLPRLSTAGESQLR